MPPPSPVAPSPRHAATASPYISPTSRSHTPPDYQLPITNDRLPPFPLPPSPFTLPLMLDPFPTLRPASPDDLAAAVRHAAASTAQLRITGTNSLPLTAFDPDRPTQPISTLRLNKILHHAVSDMTVSVHAGISLEALQRHLAWHNQWLPLDPPIIGRPTTPAVFNGAGQITSPTAQAAVSPNHALQPPLPKSQFPIPKPPNPIQHSAFNIQHSVPPSSRTLGGLIASNSLGPLASPPATGAASSSASAGSTPPAPSLNPAAKPSKMSPVTPPIAC